MKIIWISSNRLGFELLKEAIRTGIKVSNIVTLSDASKVVMYDGIDKRKWPKLGPGVIEIEDINREAGMIRKLASDLIVVCGWRQVIGKEILKIPPKGIVGFHPTILPHGRGSAPIINTILKGEKESGLTMFYLKEGVDEGDIIAQEKFCIGRKDHASDVYNKLIKCGRKLIRNFLPAVIAGTAPRIPQTPSNVTVFRKPDLKDNRIDLENEPLETIYRKIKALSKPYRGAYIERDGKKLIIWNAELKEG